MKEYTESGPQEVLGSVSLEVEGDTCRVRFGYHLTDKEKSFVADLIKYKIPDGSRFMKYHTQYEKEHVCMVYRTP